METLYNKNAGERIFISIIVAALVVLFAILTSVILTFNIVQNLVMSWVLTTLYALFAFFFIEPANISVNKIINRPVYKQVPVYINKEVPVYTQIPVENKTIEIVEKEVIKEVPIYVRQPVIKEVIKYIEKPKIKLNIPHFKFIASSQTKTFHTRFCRLGKLVKKKNKIHNNSQAFFKKKHFKACKICIKHQRKA